MPKKGGNLVDDSVLEGVLKGLAKGNALAIQLPGLAYGGVDDRLVLVAKGGLLHERDELLGNNVNNGQRYRAKAVYLDGAVGIKHAAGHKAHGAHVCALAIDL